LGGFAEGLVAAGSDEAAGGALGSSDDLQPTTAIAERARAVVTSMRGIGLMPEERATRGPGAFRGKTRVRGVACYGV
jgi:hypothetical protein